MVSGPFSDTLQDVQAAPARFRFIESEESAERQLAQNEFRNHQHAVGKAVSGMSAMRQFDETLVSRSLNDILVLF